MPSWVGVHADAFLFGFGLACAAGFVNLVPIVGISIVRRLIRA